MRACWRIAEPAESAVDAAVARGVTEGKGIGRGIALGGSAEQWNERIRIAIGVEGKLVRWPAGVPFKRIGDLKNDELTRLSAAFKSSSPPTIMLRPEEEDAFAAWSSLVDSASAAADRQQAAPADLIEDGIFDDGDADPLNPSLYA